MPAGSVALARIGRFVSNSPTLDRAVDPDALDFALVAALGPAESGELGLLLGATSKEPRVEAKQNGRLQGFRRGMPQFRGFVVENVKVIENSVELAVRDKVPFIQDETL